MKRLDNSDSLVNSQKAVSRWTDDQKNAINHNGSSVIVSAAAGSGKTAVLVERILRKISGETENPCDCDKLLVVTFTNAAASEMRAKIMSAISDRLHREPYNARLRRQLSLMSSSNIQTVHSFCLNLIRENFHLVGLQPDFKVFEEAYVSQIKEECLSEVLEERYLTINDDADFRRAVEWFSDFRGDKKFADAVIDIYDKLQSHADPELWMDEVCRNMCVRGISDAGITVWGAYLLSRAADTLERGIRFLKHGLELAGENDTVFNAYQSAFNSDLEWACDIRNACRDKCWNRAFDLCTSYSPERLKSVRGFEDRDFLDSIKSCRDIWKKCIADVKNRFILCSSEVFLKDIEDTKPVIVSLFSVIRQFSKLFYDTKLAQGGLDFSDLEHMALSLLSEVKDGKVVKSGIALDMERRFEEIMVDEYQDTNEVQDRIFSYISRNGSNLFMVGDVKQSIYRFRLADPSIFLDKYLSYRDYKERLQGKPVNIVMSKNFRSRKQVLDTVNYIFERIMSRKLGDIDYGDKEKLYLGAGYKDEENECYKSECYFIDMMDDRDYESSEDEETSDNAETEAAFIAERIKRLYEEGFKVTDKDSGELRPMRYSDAAILLRSMSTRAGIYRAALLALGIPCVTDEQGEFYNTEEIITIISLIRIINNFCQDVYVISALRGPVYGFTADELAEIRIENRDVRFFEAVRRYSEESDKCRDFIRDISFYRSYVLDKGVSSLIWRIYSDKKLLNIFAAYENGAARRQNLLAFYQCAVSYEANSEGSLDGFVYFIDELIKSGRTPASAAKSGGDGVRIMSIHKSKGLEFPIVAVCGCGCKFNEEDTKKPVLFHSGLGLGIKSRDIDRMVEHKTAVRQAVSDKIRNEAISEELRILYVALTRAKEKLIITLTLTNAEKSFCKWARSIEVLGFSPDVFMEEHSPAMWIGGAFLKHRSADSLRNMVDIQVLPDLAECMDMNISVIGKDDIKVRKAYVPDSQADDNEISGCLADAEGENYDEWLANYRYVYRYAGSCGLPSKLTATELNRMEENMLSDDEFLERIKLREPDFSSGEKEITPAERGIANHLVMQYIRFEVCQNRQGIEEEIKRLNDNRIMSERQLMAVDVHKIERFFESDIAKRIENADTVKKEYRFSMLSPADRYYETAASEDEVLLQGVVDCMFAEGDEIVILDFKSDFVRKGEAQTAAHKYSVQLETYCYAMERITGKKVKEYIVYFLETGEYSSTPFSR